MKTRRREMSVLTWNGGVMDHRSDEPVRRSPMAVAASALMGNLSVERHRHGLFCFPPPLWRLRVTCKIT